MGRLIAYALVVLALALPRPVLAASFSQLFVFGDSLSDGGNAFVLSGGLFPPSPPYAQRLSNGPVAAEYLAASLGIPLAPSVVPGGTNFAVGGATTGVQNFNFEVDSPAGLQGIPVFATSGIAAQIAAFQAGGFAFNPASTLFMVFGGPNDFFLASALGTDLAAAAAQAVNNLALDVAALALSGAQHLLVPNLPNLGKTPGAIAGGPVVQAGLEALSAGFNLGLAQAMAQVESLFGIDVVLFDTFNTFSGLLANPAAFGFTNATTACIATPDLLTGCQGYVFFDSVHPTTAGHALLGAALAAAVPGPASLVLLVAGVTLLGRARRTGPSRRRVQRGSS